MNKNKVVFKLTRLLGLLLLIVIPITVGGVEVTASNASVEISLVPDDKDWQLLIDPGCPISQRSYSCDVNCPFGGHPACECNGDPDPICCEVPSEQCIP